MESEDKSILVFILPKYLTKKTQIPNKNPILRGAFLVSSRSRLEAETETETQIFFESETETET